MKTDKQETQVVGDKHVRVTSSNSDPAWTPEIKL
jgi:hypothetical protein